MTAAPAIMVSSTCYDLSQVRQNLMSFIEGLGYRPLLSEFESFPIDPDLNTVENCLARVKRDADIMILVIGGRYGSVDHVTEKSITNLEFLTARAKGIPIYVFIDNRVCHILPAWRQNKSGDFSGIVDPKVFEFVEYVQSQERVWTSGFDSAQDIVTAMRRQLAYLFTDSLRTRLKLKGEGLPSYLSDISPKALKIALERPRGWEGLLLFQAWKDEVSKRKDALRTYRAGITLGVTEHVDVQDVAHWFLDRMKEIKNLVNAAMKLINDSTQVALGPTGSPGDPEEILWISRLFGELLDHQLQWVNRCRLARHSEIFQKTAELLPCFATEFIDKCETFPDESLLKIKAALAAPQTDQILTIAFNFTLDAPALQADFNKAFEEALENLDQETL